MVKRLSLLLAALGMLLPVAVSALGLGEIRLSSALNEPLRAEIPLISIDVEEIDVLSVRLATREQYEQAGIEQVPELRQLRFEPTTAADGSPVIRVTTRESVAEPFLNFLIEVNWPTGRVVREYTLLLDPPTLMRGAPPVSQLPAVTEPAAARPPSVSAPSIAPPTGGQYGPVLQGETLWQIAQAVRPDPSVTVDQVMLALQQANPEAFIRNNINLLRAGVVLRVPSREEMAALAADEARASARAQTADWESYRGQAAERVSAAPRTEAAATPAPDATPEAEAPARLELVVPEKQPDAAPSTAPEGAGAPAGVGEISELRRQLDLATEEAEARRLQNEELNNQIRDLEEQVAALETLLELNVDEMAALQQNLQAQEAAAETAAAEGAMATSPAGDQSAEAMPAEGQPAGEATPTEEATPAEAEMAQGGGEAAAGAPAEAEPAGEEKPAEGEHGHAAGSEAAHGHAEEAKPAAAPPPPPPPPAPEPGLFEDPILLGGAAVILLALIGVIVAKRRGKGGDEAAASEDSETEQLLEAMQEEKTSGGLMGRLTGLFSRKGKAEAEEVAADESEAEEAPFEAAPAAAAEAPAAPVAEASQEPSFEAGEATGRDVLNEFAPEGVGGQEEGEDPLERADVFLAYGRSDQAEEVLRGLLGREPGRVDAMVKLLEIYSGNQDRASFERQLEDLHEALAGEGGPHWERAVELGRGIAPDHRLLATTAAAAAATGAAAAEALADDEEISLDQIDTDELDLDFDFEPVYGDEGEGEGDAGEPLDITQEFTGGELGDLADEGAVDAALSGEAQEDGGDAPVDLGFDLEGDTEAGAEEQSLGGGFDLEGADESPETADELGGLDLDAEEEAPAETAAADDDAGFDLDLDMGDFEAPEEEAASDAAEPTDAEAAGADRQPDLEETLAGADLGELDDLGDLGDFGDLDATLTGDEEGFDAGANMVDTKLELASTYLDMDDHEGAKGILEEVMAEGSDAQKAKAQELLGRIPG